MNILLVTSIFPPEIGGPATYTFRLARDLAKVHHVEVVTFAQKDTSIPYPCQVHHISTVGNTISRQTELFRCVFKLLPAFDIVFCQDPLVVGVAPMLAAILRHKPVLVKFVGDIIWEEAKTNGYEGTLEEFYKQRKTCSLSNTIKARLQKFVLLKSEKIITPSQYLKQFLIDNYEIPLQRIEVISNGVEVQEGRKTHNTFTAISIGRLVPYKHIDGILRALAGVSGMKLLIGGDGPDKKKLIHEAKKLKITNRVKFLGRLTQDQVRNILQKTQLFILNSAYEGMPHVLLEAAAARNVIIAPALPGVKEVFTDKEAFLFEPGNGQALLDKMQNAYNNGTLRNRLAEKAYQKVKSQFNWEATLSKTEKILIEYLRRN